MKIALCDDEQFHSVVLKRVIEQWSTDQEEVINIHVFESAEDFLTAYEKGTKYDLAFLDIQMGGMNGVELAKLIRERDMSMIIVFVTSFIDYVLLGYEVDAYRFLMKPVREKKVLETLEAAYAIYKRRQNGSFSIFTGLSTYRVAKSDIVYFEADSHYLNVRTIQEKYRMRGNLSDLADEFAKPVFTKCNRGVIINVEHISIIHKDQVKMITNDEFTLSRTYWDEINACYLAVHWDPLVQSIVRSAHKKEAEGHG